MLLIRILSCPSVWSGGNNNHAQSGLFLLPNPNGSILLVALNAPPTYNMMCKAKDYLALKNPRIFIFILFLKIPPYAILLLIITYMVTLRLIILLLTYNWYHSVLYSVT